MGKVRKVVEGMQGTAAADLASNLRTVSSLLTTNRGSKGEADLERLLPSLCELTGRDRRSVAELIACATRFGANPPAYLNHLIQTGAKLADYQRTALKEHVERMLAGGPPAASVKVPQVRNCPACGCKRLAQRPGNRVQCWECAGVF